MHIINKILITGAIAAMVTACSDQETTISQSEWADVTISLNVGVNHGMRIMSRSSDESEYNSAPRRPVVWEGQQSIIDLRIYVFEGDTPEGEFFYAGGGNIKGDGSYLIEDFYNPTPWQSKDPESHVYMFKPRLKKGKYYKFLAVGRDDVNSNAIPDRFVSYIPWGTKTLSNANFEIGVTELHEASLTNMLLEGHYPYVTTEIFTGVMTYNDNEGNIKEDYVYIDKDETGFEKSIELNRAVAGLWVYVTDIPTKAVDNTGRPNFNGMEFSPNELTIHMPVTTDGLNLVGRCESADAQRRESAQIGYIDFTNRYGELGSKTWRSTGASDYWMRGYIDNYRGVRIESNCALISNYLMPFDSEAFLDEDEATFTLQLREYEGDFASIHRVKCRIESVTDPLTGETTPYEGESYRFPVKANCLYTIGKPDEPYSLAKLGANAVTSRADDDCIVMTVMVQK